MSQPDITLQSAISVVEHDGVAALRTEEHRGDPGRGGGMHVEYLKFIDPVEGLRIANELAQLCRSRIKQAEG